MSSRAELDKIFPSLVKKYTDRRGYTDWFSLVEDLQLKENYYLPKPAMEMA